MGYVLCDYEYVKRYFPEFESVLRKLEEDLIARANAKWSPLKYGGITPKSGEYGKSTIIPSLFKDNAGNVLTTWEQEFTATGSQTILTGAASGGTIYEDYMVGFVGFAFLDPVIRVTEIKMQISDKKLPRINLEEAYAYKKPAIVFEEGFILDEETGFELIGYVEATGLQRIKPIGIQLNRVPNKLQITDTGAALT